MATRGRKPKPRHLHVVEGTLNTTRHGAAAEAVTLPERKGELAKPKYLKGRAAALWDEVAGMCWWLGEADSFKLGLWCTLQAEHERGPNKMVAARIAQLRALGSELGLDPGSRSRLGGPRKKGDEEEGNTGYFT